MTEKAKVLLDTIDDLLNTFRKENNCSPYIISVGTMDYFKYQGNDNKTLNDGHILEGIYCSLSLRISPSPDIFYILNPTKEYLPPRSFHSISTCNREEVPLP